MKKIALLLCLAAFSVQSAEIDLSQFREPAAGKGPEMLRNTGLEEKNTAAWPLPAGYVIEAHKGRNESTGLCYRRTNPDEYLLPHQKVKLPGGTYEIGCWIKTENVTGAGATLCVEIYDAKNGKYIAGTYLNHVKGNSDWTLVRGEFTAPEQPDLEYRVTPFLRKGGTGTAYYDDFFLRRLGDKYSVYPTRTSSGIVNRDGVLTLRAAVNGKMPEAEKKLLILLQNSHGQWTKPPAAGVAEFQIPETAFDKGKPSDFKVYLLDLERKHILYRDTLSLQYTPVPPQGENFGTVGRDNIFRLNGKKFMPLGFYAHIDEKNIALCREAGGNVLMSYGVLWQKWPGHKTPLDAARAMMDALDAAGLKLLFSLKDVYETGSGANPVNAWYGVRGSDNVAAKAVELFRDHPALLGWYIADEISSSRADEVKKRRTMLNRLDPGHPTWAVYYQFAELQDFTLAQDILGVDPYPIRGADSNNMSMVEFAMENASATGLPLWVVPQLHNVGIYSSKGQISGRAPTSDEMCAMSVLMAGMGAKGFIYYKLDDLFSPKLPPDNFRRQWPDTRKCFRLMKRLEPYILGSAKIQELRFRHVTGRLRAFQLTADDGRRAVLIAAIGPGTASGVLNLPGRWHSETGRTINKNGKAQFRGQDISYDVLYFNERI